MQWLKNRWYQDQYYKITIDGNQVSMMDTCAFKYILHIQHKDTTKYHFIVNEYTLNSPYKVLGMSIRIGGKDYILPPNDFIVSGNELFNEIFTLWLCKHYLYISPHITCTVTILDENADMHTCSLLKVHNNLQNDIKCIT
jgi:hypothetical protein